MHILTVSQMFSNICIDGVSLNKLECCASLSGQSKSTTVEPGYTESEGDNKKVRYTSNLIYKINFYTKCSWGFYCCLLYTIIHYICGFDISGFDWMEIAGKRKAIQL